MACKDPTQDFAAHSYSALQSYGDEQLMLELRAGNRDAFVVVFDRYYRLVLATALRIVCDMGEAEDLAQSVFFEIYSKVAQFDAAKGTLKNWILQYAYHRSINRRNYLTLRQFYDQADRPTNSGEELWTTRVAPPTQEAARLVSESLALLNSRQRQVVEMVFFEGLSLRDVAERTHQTLVNVRHHYYRGLARLRNCLSHERGEREKQPASVPLEKMSRANA